MASGGRSQLKMLEETFDFVCNACAQNNKTVEAVKYCIECKGYCCQSCTDIHNWLPILKAHNLLELSQVNEASGEQKSLLEVPTERCSMHKGKVMDMFCESHDVVGCYVCIAKYHKSCEDRHIHSIPDMIDTMYKLADCKQTHSLLKELMESMETVSNSKDTHLDNLNKAKEEVLDQVTTFQKALEAIVRKAAESSRQEVEVAYTELEKELRQAKHDAETIREDLKKTDEKLNDSKGNRAQSFVCSKMAAEQIKEADSKKMKQDLQRQADVQISFIPDQALIMYMKSLQNIGQVQEEEKQKKEEKQTHGKLKNDLYQIKARKDIAIKLSDDSKQCKSYGCCLTHDDHLIVTDTLNKKLKRVDIQTMSIVDYCTIDSQPYGVCCVSDHEVAVACWGVNKIQFVSTQNKMSLLRQVKMNHPCYGLAYNDGKLYVTDCDKSLYIYDMTGTQLKTISYDHAGNKLFNPSRCVTFNMSGSSLFVGTGCNNGIACFDVLGNYQSTFKDTNLGYVEDVCVDKRGNVFVVDQGSNDVVQFSESGNKVGVVVKQGDGLKSPLSMCFHHRLNVMCVTMRNSDVVKVYELE